MAKLTEKDVLAALGDTPETVDRELQSFAEAARVLSSSHPRLIDERPLQWVGVYQGEVAAAGASFKSVMTQLRKAGIPAEKAIVRFIDKEERALIL